MHQNGLPEFRKMNVIEVEQSNLTENINLHELLFEPRDLKQRKEELEKNFHAVHAR